MSVNFNVSGNTTTVNFSDSNRWDPSGDNPETLSYFFNYSTYKNVGATGPAGGGAIPPKPPSGLAPLYLVKQMTGKDTREEFSTDTEVYFINSGNNITLADEDQTFYLVANPDSSNSNWTAINYDETNKIKATLGVFKFGVNLDTTQNNQADMLNNDPDFSIASPSITLNIKNGPNAASASITEVTFVTQGMVGNKYIVSGISTTSSNHIAPTPNSTSGGVGGSSSL